MLQSFITKSHPPLANYFPSGEEAKAIIGSACPSNFLIISFYLLSVRMIIFSKFAEIIMSEFLAKQTAVISI